MTEIVAVNPFHLNTYDSRRDLFCCLNVLVVMCLQIFVS